MDTKDLVQYVMDDMMKYMESLPDNQVIDECVNYWDDHFENVVDEIKEYVDCEFKIPIEERQQMNELRDTPIQYEEGLWELHTKH